MPFLLHTTRAAFTLTRDVSNTFTNSLQKKEELEKYLLKQSIRDAHLEPDAKQINCNAVILKFHRLANEDIKAKTFKCLNQWILLEYHLEAVDLQKMLTVGTTASMIYAAYFFGKIDTKVSITRLEQIKKTLENSKKDTLSHESYLLVKTVQLFLSNIRKLKTYKNKSEFKLRLTSLSITYSMHILMLITLTYLDFFPAIINIAVMFLPFFFLRKLGFFVSDLLSPLFFRKNS
jgi:hypothetical protein